MTFEVRADRLKPAPRDSSCDLVKETNGTCVPNEICKRRRRRRRRAGVSAAVALIACATLCDSAAAFVHIPSGFGKGSTRFSSASSAYSSISISARKQEAAGIKAKATKNMRMTISSISNAPSKMPLLTREEETELLRQAVELRRINNLERELALRTPQSQKPLLLSVRAKNAGYGDDIDLYQEAIEAGHAARETLVARNMGLVHHCIIKIVGKHSANGPRKTRMQDFSHDELVQEGSIGLARAVDKWNPAIGGKFSTYAMHWVRAAVLRCVAERDDLLRVPTHVTQAIRQLNRAAESLGIDLGGFSGVDNSPRWQEAETARKLAEAAGLTDRQMAEAMKVRTRRKTGGYVSFEPWMQAIAVEPIYEETRNPLSSIQTNHLRTTLSKFLRPKEMEALSWRYGLISEDDEEDTELSNVNISEERRKELEKAGVDVGYLAKANSIDYVAQAEAELFGPAASQTLTSPSAKAKKVKKQASEKVNGGRWGEAMSLNEVGEKMHVSAEYARRLCHAALKKLRQAAEDGKLEPALLV